jgi:hypothetical protein
MNKATLFTAIFLLTGLICINTATADDKPGSTKSTGKVSTVVYPNPVVNVVTITCSEPIQEPIVETFNVNGQRVETPVTGGNDGSNKMQVDMSSISPGIYILRVMSGKDLIHVQQLIKY